ncbi:hypothetical protein DFH09DRAFT_1313226 [Mycena vulgaris]|nr:hypothetical protein DFH09DRAFT_1313226 [Mycena vulgaris]
MSYIILNLLPFHPTIRVPIPTLDLRVGKPAARLRRVANCSELSLWVGRVGDAPSARPSVSPGSPLLALRAALSRSHSFPLAAARSAFSLASQQPAAGAAFTYSMRKAAVLPPSLGAFLHRLRLFAHAVRLFSHAVRLFHTPYHNPRARAVRPSPRLPHPLYSTTLRPGLDQPLRAVLSSPPPRLGRLFLVPIRYFGYPPIRSTVIRTPLVDIFAPSSNLAPLTSPWTLLF